MNSKSILIFAKTPYSKTPYDRWLFGKDIQPLILTPKEFASGYRHLPHVYEFSNYDHNQMVEKTALDLARRFPLIGVFARAEADVIRAAELRELLNLPGQKTGSALAFRNKVIMKNHLDCAGVTLPRYQLLDSAYTAISFIAEHGYPVVIKPCSESGSLGTRILRNPTDLEAYLTNPLKGEAEIETFINGKMYHVDGLILNGRIEFIHPFMYINDCLSFRKNEYIGSCALSAQNPLAPRLVSAVRKILSALPLAEHMAFHAELWRTPDDNIVFCEIASRTGGGLISAMIHHCFGFDIDRHWFEAECGFSRSLQIKEYRPGGFTLIPPLNGILQRLPRDNEPRYVREKHIMGTIGERYHGGVKSGLFLAGYVIDGTNEEEVKNNIADVADWFANQTQWQFQEGV